MDKKSALVIKAGKQSVTTSRIIAREYGRSHKNVLQAIENHLQQASDTEFSRLNFQPRDYSDSRGKTQPEYLLTEDGFAVIALAFTGPKATDTRVAFIKAFRAALRRISILERREPEWQDGRKMVALYQRSMTDKLVAAREAQGKTTQSHHFSNEALLLTFALLGKAKPPIDRDNLDADSLRLFSRIEELNGSLILAGLPYEKRKGICRDYVKAEKALPPAVVRQLSLVTV